MRSEFSIFFPKIVKTRAPRKPARKAIKVGCKVRMHLDGNTYTVVERDTRYPSA
jgi:hypothetical protein